VTPPIIISTSEDCAFYRRAADAVRFGVPADAKAFDADGTRLVAEGGELRPATNPDGADELAALLRAWLGNVDALRESTANWTLALLVQASVDHQGYA
jgi:hypothetical protein